MYTLNIQGCIVTYNGTIKKYILSNLGNALIIHNVIPKIQVTNLLFDNTNKKLMALSIEDNGFGVVWNMDNTTPKGDEKLYGQISWILE